MADDSHVKTPSKTRPTCLRTSAQPPESSLYDSFEQLNLHWSAQKGSHQAKDDLDEQASLMQSSHGSFSLLNSDDVSTLLIDPDDLASVSSNLSSSQNIHLPETVFERLFRNERRKRPAKRPKAQDSYRIPRNETRRQTKQQTRATASTGSITSLPSKSQASIQSKKRRSNSPSTVATTTSSVYERLYYGTERQKPTTLRSSSHSVASSIGIDIKSGARSISSTNRSVASNGATTTATASACSRRQPTLIPRLGGDGKNHLSVFDRLHLNQPRPSNNNRSKPKADEPHTKAIAATANTKAIEAAKRIARAWKDGRQRRILLGITYCVIMIQAAWRGLCARRKLHKAACLIQATWRMSRGRRIFLGKRSWAMDVQSTWRMYLARCRWRKQRDATTRVQRFWRRTRRLAMMTKIANAWRQSDFLYYESSCEAAGLFVESFWRSHCEDTSSLHVDDEEEEDCIITATGWTEGDERDRKEQTAVASNKEALTRMHFAALKIQAWWRMNMVVTSYLVAQYSATVIQQYYREWLHACLLVQALQKDEAAKRLQQSWRSVRCCLALAVARTAAIIIQTAFRGLQERKQLEYCLGAVLKIQRTYRGARGRKRALSRTAAVVKLQAHVRGTTARIYLAIARSASIMIQSLIKRRITKNILATSALQATRIQRSYRRRLSRRHYAAIIIQASVRRALAQNNILLARTFERSLVEALQKDEAAQRIQQFWRSVRCCLELAVARTAAIIIQSAFRGLQDRKQLDHCLAAVLRIQRFSRGARGRQLASLRNSALVKLHDYFRATLARNYLAKARSASIMIQAVIRRCITRNTLSRLSLHATRIQRFYRCLVSRRHNAAIIIQASVRRSLAQDIVRIARTCALTIQSIGRMRASRKRFKKAIASVSKVQSWWRLQLNYSARILCSATRIQAWGRGTLQARTYRRYCLAAIMLQSSWRYKTRTTRSLLLQKICCAIVIQSTWRRYVPREYFLRYRGAAIIAQKLYRRLSARQGAQSLRLMNAAALSLQLFYCHTMTRQSAARMQSGVLLLKLSIEGKLSRSSRMSFLLQINGARRCLAVQAHRRFVSNSQMHPNCLLIFHYWSTTAELMAAILLQRAFRNQRQRRIFCMTKHSISDDIVDKQYTSRPSARRSVAIVVNEKLDDQRLRVEFCTATFVAVAHAASALQFFAEQICLERNRLPLTIIRNVDKHRLRVEIGESYAGLRRKQQASRTIQRCVRVFLRRVAAKTMTAKLQTDYIRRRLLRTIESNAAARISKSDACAVWKPNRNTERNYAPATPLLTNTSKLDELTSHDISSSFPFLDDAMAMLSPIVSCKSVGSQL
jgi:uncharacterized membrane protein (UPF0136 family)